MVVGGEGYLDLGAWPRPFWGGGVMKIHNINLRFIG